MRTRYFVISLILLILTGIVGCYVMATGAFSDTRPSYTTQINRLLLEIEADWDDISLLSEESRNSDEPFDYVILDRESKCLLYTDEDMARSIPAATSHYDIIRNIEKDGELVGTLIVNNSSEKAEHIRDIRAAIFIAVVVLVMIVAMTGYYIYLRKRVIAPFGKMKSMATRVAAGDLDTPLQMDKENVFGEFTEAFDIMREELKSSREREENAVRSRKELVAELSHDIKTPVASIKAMADVMSLTADDENTRDTIAAINSKADQIDKLISNLFHATLEELEQLEVRSDELASSEIVAMVREADYLHKLAVLDIKEAVISADPLRLEQVIGNIIANSYKYAGTAISVTSFFEQELLVLEFADKGGGVPEEELEKIMQKFARGSNAAGKDGSGLGLYISQYLMRKMGGDLTCFNRDGGFVVRVSIRLL